MKIFSGTKLISIWAAAAALVLQTAGANPSCKPRGVGDDGFTVSLYRYPYADLSAGADQCYSDRYKDDIYDDQGKYLGFPGYSDYGFIGSASGVTNLTMDLPVSEKCTPTLGRLPANFNFEDEFDISNFTMHIQGFYYAETSGYYTVMGETDDFGTFAFNFTGYDCCGLSQYPEEWPYWPSPGDYEYIQTNSENGPGSQKFSVKAYLQAGSYYLFDVFYVNKDASAFFSLTYTDPSGELHTDYTGNVFQFAEKPSECPIGEDVYITSLVSSYSGGPSGTSTVTGTSVGDDGYGTIRTTYTVFEYDVIETSSGSSAPSASSSAPSVSSSSISSNETISSYTSIKSSESSYLSFTNEPITSNSSNESIDTYPSETSTVSVTKTDTVTGTTTVTTDCTEGDVTAPTTYSTATVTVTGPDGIVTTETTYYVKTPATSSGTATNKYSNDTATRYETVFSTVYSYCSCSDVSIYSTDVVTVTTTNANGSPEKVIQTNHYVQVPETMTTNPDMGSAVAAALASKTTEVSIPKYSAITTGLSTYSGAASGLSTSVFTFAVGLLFAMVVV